MQTEWYFFDANGYTVGGDRFYINFLFQVLGGTYDGGVSSAPIGTIPAVRALSLITAATLVPADGSEAKRYESWAVFPFAHSQEEAQQLAAAQPGGGTVYYSEASALLSVHALGDDATLAQPPLMKLTAGGGGRGGSSTPDVFDLEWLGAAPAGFSFSVAQDTTSQPILMQGQPDKTLPSYPSQDAFTGLDPPATSFLAQLTGTSYLYYSWSSMVFQPGATLHLGGKAHQVDTERSVLWMDHQGGVSKAAASTISAVTNSLSVYLGLRPAVFPAWGWYSAQFLDGTVWTGFTPPLKSVEEGSGMLQGTWRDASGKLSWLHGVAEPLQTKAISRTLPDGSTFTQSYATAICFTVEGSLHSGVSQNGQRSSKNGSSFSKQFTMWAISDDQAFFSANGIDSEGGVDIYDGRVPVRPAAADAAKERIGYGNLEGVGWLPMSARIELAFGDLDVAEDKGYAAAVAESTRAREVDSTLGKMTYIAIMALLAGVVVGVLFGWYPYYGPMVVVATAFLAPWLLEGTVRRVACGVTHSCHCKKKSRSYGGCGCAEGQKSREG